jgi:flagellar protein FlaG
MEATQSLKVQRLQTGFVDVRSMGFVSQHIDKAGIKAVQDLDQIDLRTRDQVHARNQDLQKQARATERAGEEAQARGTEKAMPAILKELENKINQMQEVGMVFSQYKDSGKMIVKVVEKGTDKVIREIPSEEFLDLVEKMDQMIGILFDKKV